MGKVTKAIIEVVMPDLAPVFAVQGLMTFSVAMIQGFTIPLVPSPKLGLTCHTKTVGHAFLFWGLSSAIKYVTLGPTTAMVAKWLIISGSWGSFIGDFWGSLISQHLPLASKAAGVKCDPAEEDYTLPKDKRPKPAATPHPSTLLIKLPALAMAFGVMILLSGADFSKVI